MLTVPVPFQSQEPPLLPNSGYSKGGDVSGNGVERVRRLRIKSSFEIHRHPDEAGDREFISMGGNGLNVVQAELGVGK